MSKTTTSAQESLQLATPDGDTKVEKYEFEPIKGYPMLNWRGKRPFSATQFYPAQLKEVHGEEVDGWRNKIFWGDNLQVMSHLLKQFRAKVDLIYIDPPFDSKAEYRKKIRVKGGIVENDTNSFEEKQYGDIWNNDEYLQFMFERLVLCRELLSEKGTIYLHADWHQVHYLKILMDEVFGKANFSNEIVWKRTRAAHSDATYFGKVHDTILKYRKSSEAYFSQQFVAHSPEYFARFSREVDGRKYMLVPLHGPGQGAPREFFGKIIPPPPGRCWPTQSKIDAYIAQGIVELTSNGTPSKRSFLDENKGNPVSDWWDDVIPLNPVAQERTDYPTQKPEELLERIIKSSSAPNALVFDCFMGSGTTQAVAMKLGRKFIGADINLGAIQTTTKRLISVADELRQRTLSGDERHYTGFEVFNVNHYDVFRNPVQARELLIEALEVQKLEFSTVFDGEKDGRMVKMMPVNRIATRADLNELIAGFDYKAWERRKGEAPTRPVERVTLVCMGHEPDLAAQLVLAAKPYLIDVQVVDILRDKSNLEFKRDSEARVVIKNGELIIERFYPMNLLQKLSLQKESAGEWRELVESVLIDWNYDGAVLQPAEVDIPDKNELVSGRYKVPTDAGTIRVKITDLLSESWEGSIDNG